MPTGDLPPDDFEPLMLDPAIKPKQAEQESVAAEADRLVSFDRMGDYGHPLDDFTKVTKAAAALGIDPTSSAHHHALYMVVVKLAREVNKPKRDNRTDICGYAKTADMVLEEAERRENLRRYEFDARSTAGSSDQ